MPNIKDLRAYATARKLPKTVYLGNINPVWKNNIIDHCLSLQTELLTTFTERNNTEIYGTSVYDYNALTEIYDQRKIKVDGILLDELINTLPEVSHLRYALLNGSSTIPEHIDDPYHLRFICMLSGQHIFNSEGTLTTMKENELWFVNGAYRHSVENTANTVRIALLGNFELNDISKEMLNKK
jgi:hypothetical protein